MTYQKNGLSKDDLLEDELCADYIRQVTTSIIQFIFMGKI